MDIGLGRKTNSIKKKVSPDILILELENENVAIPFDLSTAIQIIFTYP